MTGSACDDPVSTMPVEGGRGPTHGTSMPGIESRPLSMLLTGLIVAYLGSVVLLSYREGLTLLAKLAGIALVGGFLVSAFVARRQIRVQVTFRLWGLWLFLSACAVMLADQPELAAVKVLTVAQVLVVAWVLTNLLCWHGSTRFYWMAIVVLALVSCVLVWLGPSSYTDSDGRVFGPLGNANAFGAMLVTGFILVVVQGFGRVSIALRTAWLAAAGVFFAMILQTGSRQAFLGSVVTVLVFLAGHLYRARNRARRWLVVLAAAVAVIPIGVFVASRSEYWFRIEALYSAARGDLGDTDASLAQRARLYKRAAEIFVDNPVIGIGLDNFRAEPRFMGAGPTGTYSHSNYTEVLVSTGLLGFTLYFLPFVFWIRTLYRLRHLMFHPQWFARYTSVLAITATYLVMDFATVSYYDKFVWLVFPLVIAELASMKRLRAVTIS